MPSFDDTRVGRGIREIGEMGAFAGRAFRALPGVSHYAGEVLRQMAILLVGSVMVVLALQFVAGAECGLYGAYALRATGAQGATGLFTIICDLRELFPYMFGYIIAAKVGCGLVAEIGSMRIADELDALDVIGTPSIRYIVGTRLAAAMLALPLLYVTSMGVGTIGSYLVTVLQVGDVSAGAYLSGHFGPAHGLDEDLLSMIKAMVIGITIILTCLYYGYTVSGGPAEVGRATARSMVVNLILIHVVGGATTALFWGSSIRLPLGG
jgi:phospholipid/cholesterol/gamma-HCH transport system permease protein